MGWRDWVDTFDIQKMHNAESVAGAFKDYGELNRLPVSVFWCIMDYEKIICVGYCHCDGGFFDGWVC